MTNKEAIYELKMMKRMVNADNWADKALDLAIQALEEWDRMKLICANEGVIVYKIKEEENDVM